MDPAHAFRHPHSGPAAQRIVLMECDPTRFHPSTVRVLLTERKFIGQKWIAFLLQRNLPFAIRPKAQQIMHIGGCPVLL